MVFVGTATSSSFLQERRYYRGTYREYETEFDVLQVWKGDLTEGIRLRGPAPIYPSEPMLIYSDGDRIFFGGECGGKWSGPVWWARRDMIELAAVFVGLTALPTTVLLLTLSKALRSYHDRFLAG